MTQLLLAENGDGCTADRILPSILKKSNILSFSVENDEPQAVHCETAVYV